MKFLAVAALALLLGSAWDAEAAGRKVGGYTTVLTATPVIDNGAYAAGDLMGFSEIPLMPATLDTGLAVSTGMIQAVIIIDDDAQEVNLDVYFFDSEPSGTTFTDQAAFNPVDADLHALIGVASINDWKSQSNNSIGQALNLGMPFSLAAGSSTLYAVLVTRGAPTYAVDGLTLRVMILQD